MPQFVAELHHVIFVDRGKTSELSLPIQLDAGFQQIKSEGGGMHSVHNPRYDASGGNGLHDSEMPAGESFPEH
jgi:hypothetical protein